MQEDEWFNTITNSGRQQFQGKVDEFRHGSAA